LIGVALLGVIHLDVLGTDRFEILKRYSTGKVPALAVTVARTAPNVQIDPSGQDFRVTALDGTLHFSLVRHRLSPPST
jgi:hypothetical protein